LRVAIDVGKGEVIPAEKEKRRVAHVDQTAGERMVGDDYRAGV
jgi:hypothetical protein